MWKLRLVILAVVIIGFNNAAAKSDPYVEDPDDDWGDSSSPVEVWSAEAAVAHYGRLGTYGDVDAFAFTFDAPVQDWPVAASVPDCGEHFQHVYPAMALIGPGLNQPASNELPFAMPEGAGAEVFTKERREFTNGTVEPYEASLVFDIPRPGTYLLAIWEPEGNAGAYMLSTGSRHDQFAERAQAEWDAVIQQLDSGGWMGQDCDAPLAAETCPATSGQVGGANLPTPPERATVGDGGFVLTGVVRDAATCLPLADAQLTFWLVNEQGEYDADHEGRLFTNQQGRYRIESNRPGSYGPPGHIHLAIGAPGYGLLVTEYVLGAGEGDAATFDMALRPE
jgi:hypothetical protein